MLYGILRMKASLNKNNRIVITPDVRIPPELSMMNPPKSFPLCGDIVRRLRDRNPELELSDSLRRVLSQIVENQRRVSCVVSAQTDTIGDSRLYPYQRIGVEWLLAIKRGILADDQGLGKTVMAAAACKKIYDGIDGRVGYADLIHPLTVGIVCTGSNIAGWTEHMQRYHLDGVVCASKKKGEAVIDHGGSGFTYIVNYDNLASLVKLDLDVLIVDEAHHARNRKTIIFKRLRPIARKAEYVFLLTASPTVNADFDMWTLLNLCDPERFPSYWSYIFRFFEVSHTGFGMKVGEIKENERENFERMISAYMLRRDESVIKLPNIMRVKAQYELPEQHREIYNQMEKEWVVEFDDKTISVNVKIAQITRLRQLAISPRILFPSYSGPDKIDLLVHEILATDDTVVVFTSFAEAADLACERLEQAGIPSAVYSGAVPLNKRKELEQQFGINIRALIVTHKTGGESLTLVQASRAIFLDLAWHPAGNRHAMKRIHRIGQQNQVVAEVIQSVDTVEMDMEDLVRLKGDMRVNELFRRIKERHGRTS